jgi:hypothetical protein
MDTHYVWAFLFALSFLLWTTVAVHARQPESLTMRAIRGFSGRKWVYLIAAAMHISAIEMFVLMRWNGPAFMIVVALCMQLWGMWSRSRAVVDYISPAALVVPDIDSNDVAEMINICRPPEPYKSHFGETLNGGARF